MKKPKKIKDYVCGTCGDVDLSNREPLAQLLRRDTFYAFDFPVYVTGVFGGNGIFSGEGEIRVPFFNKAKMIFIFDNIEINSDYQMIGGFAEATGFGIEVLPPWADALLAGVIAGLEQWDASLEQQQVSQLDSLLLCCSEYMDDEMAENYAAISDCFAAADPPPSASYDACSQMMDVALETMYDDLTNLADTVRGLKKESMVIDLIWAALLELKEEWSPGIQAERDAYEAKAAPFRERYSFDGLEGDGAPIPSYLTPVPTPRVLDCPPDAPNNNSSLQEFVEGARTSVEDGYTITEHELYATLAHEEGDQEDIKISEEDRHLIKQLAEVIRDSSEEGDLDVFALTQAAVNALDNENEELRTLLPEVKANLILKLIYLVNN
jgi:hypothetical protein